MDSIGAEVGQKMRSAIKAKLLELNCYVDDELPDYIMVMVANKRTKSQMNEDLNLFLSTKTSTFVEWLHIVLKKLKEVTVTNPEVYKKVAKRKSSDYPDFNIKEERKHLNIMLKCEKNESHESSYEFESHKLSEHRKVTVVETQQEDNFDDNFDIPLLSDVNLSSQEDLDNIERKIKSVKSRLGLLVESDAEDELFNAKDEIEDNLRGKNEDISMHHSLRSKISKTNIIEDSETNATIESRSQSDEKGKHTPITFDVESPKKLSILDRLGKRTISGDKSGDHKRIRLDRSESRIVDSSSKYSRDDSDEQKERSRSRRKDYRNISSSRKDRRPRERRLAEKKPSGYVSDTRKERSKGILSRLGVMSKISIPQKQLTEPEPEDELRTREVRSVVQVKPRVIPTDVPQPNKSLLLKAVAEAHRSIAQTPNVGSSKRIKSKLEENYEQHVSPKLSQNEKNKLRNIILAQICRSTQQLDGGDNKEEVYIPKSLIQNDSEAPKYIPSSSKSSEELSEKGTRTEQHFIITLEGTEKSLDHRSASENAANEVEPRSRISAKSRLDRRKVPSPVTFDRLRKKVSTKSNVPDKLPVVRTPQSIKNKERCKYWPNCRQGDKCEFVHPVTNCEMFPHCQFRDQCIYLHPHCKFGPSCTKRDCPYSHTVANKATGATKGYVPIKMNSTLQNCKYFPHCTNPSCPYYHPKPCKYGKYCKNPTGCTFSHTFSNSKSSLSWRSK